MEAIVVTLGWVEKIIHLKGLAHLQVHRRFSIHVNSLIGSLPHLIKKITLLPVLWKASLSLLTKPTLPVHSSKENLSFCCGGPEQTT